MADLGTLLQCPVTEARFIATLCQLFLRRKQRAREE